MKAGVSCVSCHGRVDQMVEVKQVQPLTMAWCLDCHRNPAPNIRPAELGDQARLAAGSRPGGNRARNHPGQAHRSADQLLGVPPMKTRERILAQSGQLAETPQFREWLQREFPEAPRELDSASRRTLLKLMAASFGLAGLTACRRPVEKILPVGQGRRRLHPRQSAVLRDGDDAGRRRSTGLLVETHDGRPTKIEGNPRHPLEPRRGVGLRPGLDPEPVRSGPRRTRSAQNGRKSNWDEFARSPSAFGGDAAEGLRFLSERSIRRRSKRCARARSRRFPGASGSSTSRSRDATKRCRARSSPSAQPLQAHYHFDKADVILSLDADFLGLELPRWPPSRDFAGAPRVATRTMNRLYVVESQFSLTGAMADHRLRMRSECDSRRGSPRS